MTVDELLGKLQAAASDGYGKANVVFDTDAACFNVHIVDLGSAFLDPGEGTPSGEPLFIMSTSTYHGTCDCKRGK